MVVLGIVGLAAVQGSYYYSDRPPRRWPRDPAPVPRALPDRALRPGDGWANRQTHGAGRGRRPGGNRSPDRERRPRGANEPDHGNGWSASARAIWFSFYIVYSKRRLSAISHPRPSSSTPSASPRRSGRSSRRPGRSSRPATAPNLWGMFLALALFSTLVPFTFFYAGLRRMPATQAGILSTLEPVIAVVSAALVLGEALRPLQNLGAVLVLARGAFSLRPRSTRRYDRSLSGDGSSACLRELLGRRVGRAQPLAHSRRPCIALTVSTA